MNSENTGVNTNSGKWQRMAALVQQSVAEPGNFTPSFNRLVLSRLLFRNLIVFFLQYAGLMFSTLSSPFSTIWFASGTACAFVFLRGYNIIPGIWLGSILAYYFAGLDLEKSCLCALVLSLQALLLVKLNYRSFILSPIFYERSSILKFIGYCALVSAAGSFLLAFLCFSALSQTTSFAQVCLEWWLANFNGMVLISCALVTWDAYFPELRKLKTLNRKKLLLFFGALFFLYLGLLESKTLMELCLFISLSWLALLGSGWVFKRCGAMVAIFLLALFMGFAVLFQAPLFHIQQPYLILSLDVFLSVCAISAMVAVV